MWSVGMLNRQDTHNLLLAQLNSLELKVIAVSSRWLWEVELPDEDGRKTYMAVILPTSFDWWRKRYHLAKHKPTLIICYEHTTCINVPVLALHDGYLYAPCHFPPWFHDYADRTTQKGKQVFIGALLSGVASAFDALDKLPRSTQYRYRNDLKSLRRKKRGRPVDGKNVS